MSGLGRGFLKLGPTSSTSPRTAQGLKLELARRLVSIKANWLLRGKGDFLDFSMRKPHTKCHSALHEGLTYKAL